MIVLALTSILLAGPADELRARASAAERSGDLAEASARWIEVAKHEGITEDERVGAAITAAGYAGLVADDSGELSPLCAAHEVLGSLGGTLGDPVLAADVAEAAARVMTRLEKQAGDAWRERCTPKREVAPALAETAPIEPAPKLLPIMVPFESDRDDGQALFIAGAITTGFGALFLGGMGAALYQWDRDSETLESFAQEATPGSVPLEDQLRASELDQRTLMLRPLAITAGVLGVTTTITGAALLIAGSRKRARTLSLHPVAGQGLAGVFFKGSF
ncbi:MAG: hypothetical protein H6713_22145 [Myxococcales bacterium]|nr:hypothetical protein [Myxococcales bacterium]MCB9752665.1 hypothetical protein [Myxococcales bacterium]